MNVLFVTKFFTYFLNECTKGFSISKEKNKDDQIRLSLLEQFIATFSAMSGFKYNSLFKAQISIEMAKWPYCEQLLVSRRKT